MNFESSWHQTVLKPVLYKETVFWMGECLENVYNLLFFVCFHVEMVAWGSHNEYVADFFCTDPAGCAEEDVDKKCMHIKTALTRSHFGDRVGSI